VSEDGSPVAVTVEVAAPPERVWALVSDVTRMGEWSPETTACDWVGDADGPEVGARFRGRNQIGWRRWSTTCTVTAADPGRRFAFRVASVGGLPVADWSFEMAPTEGGCRVTESCTDRRGRIMHTLGRLVTGVADRDAHNRPGMEQTLARLSAAATAS
jgi:uncharacterized protein YndB with AHSA1/START domain